MLDLCSAIPRNVIIACFNLTSSQEVTFFFLGTNIFQYLNLARGLSKRAPQQRLTKLSIY